jgi:hypothetical protein
VLLVLALARLVLAGLVPAAFALLARLAMPLVGSAWRLDLLAPGGIVAGGFTPSSSLPGSWGLAAWPARGQRRPPSRRRHRPAGPGILHRQAEPNADEGPHQRPDHDQVVAATAKRPTLQASKVDHSSLGCRGPVGSNLRTTDHLDRLTRFAWSRPEGWSLQAIRHRSRPAPTRRLGAGWPPARQRTKEPVHARPLGHQPTQRLQHPR